jgi:hypothetical protein
MSLKILHTYIFNSTVFHYSDMHTLPSPNLIANVFLLLNSTRINTFVSKPLYIHVIISLGVILEGDFCIKGYEE